MEGRKSASKEAAAWQVEELCWGPNYLKQREGSVVAEVNGGSQGHCKCKGDKQGVGGKKKPGKFVLSFVIVVLFNLICLLLFLHLYFFLNSL